MNSIIDKTEAYVKATLRDAEGGHDWWHIHRVRNIALRIAKEESADLFIIELGALLHDIADAKFHGGNEEIGPQKARQFLKSIEVPEETVEHIDGIIRNISFKNSFDETSFSSLELSILQDADRLDAIGAIGIARAFSYGGLKGRAFYDPDIPPLSSQTKDQYKSNQAPTINHFYEKLLRLKDMMHTQTAKNLAEERHQYMEHYLEQFYSEWAGDK